MAGRKRERGGAQTLRKKKKEETRKNSPTEREESAREYHKEEEKRQETEPSCRDKIRIETSYTIRHEKSADIEEKIRTMENITGFQSKKDDKKLGHVVLDNTRYL